ncbi:histone-lysine N-methyltransferase eggless-like isoform X2 [Gigantopelta aegis]|uniref:histone-lysine N-methyltransferase eggless-like isoform X2 n=1 Tax=Gigantopelta aegis TaxID=1735272 RepID=UPI001B88A3C3|nr:histone-lysine N-methyltransferase eggless-like isoform X2 [Gigantopelta aegis]
MMEEKQQSPTGEDDFLYEFVKCDIGDLVTSILDDIKGGGKEIADDESKTTEDKPPAEDSKQIQDVANQIRLVEKKQKEINKIFQECQDQLDKYKEDLDKETDEEEVRYKEVQLAVADTLEAEMKQKQQEALGIDDSDDDIQILGSTFDPTIVEKRKQIVQQHIASRPPQKLQMKTAVATLTTSAQTTTPVINTIEHGQAQTSQGCTTVEHLRSILAQTIHRQMASPGSQPAEFLYSTIPQYPGTQKGAVSQSPQARTVTIEQLYSWPDIDVGSPVLGKKTNEIWYSGIVNDIPNKDGPLKERKFRVKFDGKGQKYLSGLFIAYREPIKVLLKVGSRCVALYRDEESDGSGNAFYAGIVAEAPSVKNQKRYLVFFDDGYAQYSESKDIHKVYLQSENVWDDIHPDSQEFIKEYLKQYPERPMVRLMKGQVVRTEWNGRWWTAKVMEVDASLVKMFFQADKRTEWIYRGSTRLEPLFKALANAEAIRVAGTGGRRHLHNVDIKANKKPLVEYTRGTSEDTSGSPVSLPPPPGKDAKKRSVAKKSTGGPRSAERHSPSQQTWEAPWVKAAQKRQATVLSTPSPGPDVKDTAAAKDQFPVSVSTNKVIGRDMASVLQERLATVETDGDVIGKTANVEGMGKRLDTVIEVNDKNRVTFVSHICGCDCLKDKEEDPLKFKGKNPLRKPMLCGWERHICKMRNRRTVMYRTPCGRRLRTIEECNHYLLITDSNLTIDMFCYDPCLHTHTEFVPMKTFCDIKDLSYGKENVPISCVNGVNREYPDYVEYSNVRMPAKGVKINLDGDFLMCCDCTDNCRDRTKCQCIQMTIQQAKSLIDQDTIGYENRRLNEPVFTGIYECNQRCACDHRCVNKVAQNGLWIRLQCFKTEKKGWGLRCLDDVPSGSFLCIYAGQLLTEKGANEDGKQYGDEYLAELDFIEVVERQKEGYESEAIEPEHRSSSDEEDEDSEKEVEQSSDSDFSLKKTNRTEKGSVEPKRHDTRRRSTKSTKSSDNKTDGEKKLKKIVIKRDSTTGDNKEWSEKKTADWVESIVKEPIVIDEEDDENLNTTSAHKEKKENIFSRIESKGPSAMEVDELPDLDPPEPPPPPPPPPPPTILQTEEKHRKRHTSAESGKTPSAIIKKFDITVDTDTDEEKPKIGRKLTARKSLGGSLWKNLPNPRGVDEKSSRKKPKENEEEGDKRPGTRYYFKDGQSCYIMDAKSMGNIGRYLNHSCSPNVFVQNIFVDTHDLRFPWVAFFAGEYIRAGTEMTWDYNYEVGSVPDKVLYCYCGSPQCRGRLL